MSENDEKTEKDEKSKTESDEETKASGASGSEEDDSSEQAGDEPSGPTLVNLDMLEDDDEDIEILEVSATDDSGFVIPDAVAPAAEEDEVDVDMDFDMDESFGEPEGDGAEVDGAEIAQLRERLAEQEALLDGATAELMEFKDRMLRSAADHENYRKRIKRERAEEKLQAASGVVKNLLPVADNLQRAVTQAESTESEDPALAGIIEGLALIQGQLFDTLTRAGLEPIDTDGTFDPAVHEAMMQEPVDDKPHMSILEIFEEGYMFNGRLLRPSRVKVALNPSAAQDVGEDETPEDEETGAAVELAETDVDGDESADEESGSDGEDSAGSSESEDDGANEDEGVKDDA